MRKFILQCALAVIAAAGSLQALPITPGVYLSPSWEATGAAGSQVGWGFYIQNYDDTNWITVTSLTVQSQTNPGLMTAFEEWLSPLGGNTDYAIAPSDYWWVDPFNLITQSGLGAYTINAAAPPGASDQGIFQLGYDVYDASPLSGGNYLGSYVVPLNESPSFLVTVTGDVADPSEVPEPGTVVLLGGGFLVMAALRRRTA